MLNTESAVLIVFFVSMALCRISLPAIISANGAESSGDKTYSCEDANLICGTPQPRVFTKSELIDDARLRALIDSNEAYVLYKCESSGCCEDETHRCLPKAAEEAKLTFSHPSPEGPNCIVSIAEWNHTKCECREASNKETLSTRIVKDSCTEEH